MGSLKKGVLGLLFGWMMALGAAVGMGILRMPHDMAKAVPDVTLYFALWAIGAVFVLVSIPTIAELSSSFKRSGGFCVFARHSFGPYVGFLVGFMDWLTWCGGLSLISLVLAEELLKAIPIIALSKQILAVCIWLFFAALNWFGVNWGSKAQIATSLLKGGGLLLVSLILFFGSSAPAQGGETAVTGSVGLAALVLGFQAVIFTFAGWEASIYLGEEIRDPGKSIPRSLLMGGVSVIALYALINIAVLTALPFSALANESLPVAAATGQVLGDWGRTLMTTLAICIMLGSISTAILIAPRVLYALSKDGLVSESASRVNEGGTPTVALLISGAATIGMLLTGTFETILSVLGLFYVFTAIITHSSLFVLRWKEPDRERPYRATGYPLVPAVALLMSCAFLGAATWSDPQNAIWAYGLLALSYPVYRLLRYFSASKPTAAP